MKLQNTFKNLNIAQRIFASVCLFSLPLGVLFCFNLDQLAANISFAQLKIEGNRYQRPLLNLLKAIGDHQALAPNSPELGRNEKRIAAQLEKLEAMERELSSDLGFSESSLKAAHLEGLRVSGIQSRWAGLKSATPGSTELLIGMFAT